MSLLSYFIPAPLSALLTSVLGISMALVFDELGLRIFRHDKLHIRALYFFAGLLALSLLVFLLAVIGFANIVVLRGLAAVIIAAAIYVAYKKDWNSSKQLVGSFINEGDNKWQKLLKWCVVATLFFIVIISLGPPTDADSLDYHLGLPVHILQSGSLQFDIHNLHFRLFGFGEMLNLFGVANGCPQLGAFIQVVALCYLLGIYMKEMQAEQRYAIAALLLGLPVYLFLFTSQKHQFTGVVATSLCFFLLSRYAYELKDRKVLWLWLATLMFCIGLKYSFVLSALPLIVWLFVKRPAMNTIVVVASFVCLVLPLLLYKYYYFGDPFSPLLERWVASPDKITLGFHNSLQRFKDSKLPFPVNLILPSSANYFTSVLGIGGIVLLVSLLSFKKYTAEIVVTISFIALTILLGQCTARFFIEPYVWLLPCFMLHYKNNIAGRVAYYAAQVQFIALLPVWLLSSYFMGRGIISDAVRDKVMSGMAVGYAEAKWIDSKLPANAVIATSIRSRSLLPRNYYPIEYLHAYQRDTATAGKLFSDMKVNYLVLGENEYPAFHNRHAGDTIATHAFYKATRNPFNKTKYKLVIYRVKE